MPLRCFRRRYWKYCTKGMRTVLYNMLGCESFISRSFRPFPRGGEQKTMIVFSFLNSGCERSGGWYGKQGGNGWATGPSFLQKSCKKAVKFIISRLFVVDLIGIEPTTLRMRTVRSPSWAMGPYWPFSIEKSYEKQIFEIFGFEEKSRKTRLVNGRRTSAAGCSFIWLQTQRPPRWTMSPSFLSCNGR